MQIFEQDVTKYPLPPAPTLQPSSDANKEMNFTITMEAFSNHHIIYLFAPWNKLRYPSYVLSGGR